MSLMPLNRAADDRNTAQRFCWAVKAVRADVTALETERAKAAARNGVPAGAR